MVVQVTYLSKHLLGPEYREQQLCADNVITHV